MRWTGIVSNCSFCPSSSLLSGQSELYFCNCSMVRWWCRMSEVAECRYQQNCGTLHFNSWLNCLNFNQFSNFFIHFLNYIKGSTWHIPHCQYPSCLHVRSEAIGDNLVVKMHFIMAHAQVQFHSQYWYPFCPQARLEVDNNNLIVKLCFGGIPDLKSVIEQQVMKFPQYWSLLCSHIEFHCSEG